MLGMLLVNIVGQHSRNVSVNSSNSKYITLQTSLQQRNFSQLPLIDWGFALHMLWLFLVLGSSNFVLHHLLFPTSILRFVVLRVHSHGLVTVDLQCYEEDDIAQLDNVRAYTVLLFLPTLKLIRVEHLWDYIMITQPLLTLNIFWQTVKMPISYCLCTSFLYSNNCTSLIASA